MLETMQTLLSLWVRGFVANSNNNLAKTTTKTLSNCLIVRILNEMFNRMQVIRRFNLERSFVRLIEAQIAAGKSPEGFANYQRAMFKAVNY